MTDKDTENAMTAHDVSNLEAEVTQLRNLVQAIDEKKEEHYFRKAIRRMRQSFWTSLYSVGFLGLAALFAVLYLDARGYIAVETLFQPLGFGAVGDGEGAAEAALDGEPADLMTVLTILVPVILAVLAAIVGVSGLRRLELYDDQFTEFRREQRENNKAYEERNDRSLAQSRSELGQALQAVTQQNSTFRTEVDKRLGDFQGALREEVENALVDHVRSLRDQVDSVKDELSKAQNTFSETMQQYDWVFGDAERRELLQEGKISSMGELYHQVSSLFQRGERSVAIELIENALTQKIRGASTDIFNLTAELGRRDQEPLALKVTMAALEYYPKHRSLLAHGLQYAGTLGETAVAEDLYKRIRDIFEEEPEDFDWRVSVFVGEYLKAAGRSADAETWCIKFVQSAREIHSRGEALSMDRSRVFAVLARVYEETGRHQKAIDICLEARKLFNISPQTEVALAEFYLAAGQLENALGAAELALSGDLQRSSDINNAGAHQIKAQVYDGMLSDLVNKQRAHDRSYPFPPEVLERAKDLARSALLSFAAANTSIDSRPPVDLQSALRGNRIISLLAEIGVSGDEIRALTPAKLPLGDSFSAIPGFEPRSSEHSEGGVEAIDPSDPEETGKYVAGFLLFAAEKGGDGAPEVVQGFLRKTLSSATLQQRQAIAAVLAQLSGQITEQGGVGAQRLLEVALEWLRRTEH